MIEESTQIVITISYLQLHGLKESKCSVQLSHGPEKFKTKVTKTNVWDVDWILLGYVHSSLRFHIKQKEQAFSKKLHAVLFNLFDHCMSHQMVVPSTVMVPVGDKDAVLEFVMRYSKKS